MAPRMARSASRDAGSPPSPTRFCSMVAISSQWSVTSLVELLQSRTVYLALNSEQPANASVPCGNTVEDWFCCGEASERQRHGVDVNCETCKREKSRSLGRRPSLVAECWTFRNPYQLLG